MNAELKKLLKSCKSKADFEDIEKRLGIKLPKDQIEKLLGGADLDDLAEKALDKVLDGLGDNLKDNDKLKALDGLLGGKLFGKD